LTTQPKPSFALPVQCSFRVGVVVGEQRQVVTVGAPGSLFDVGEWACCYCCGRSYPTTNMLRFRRHPSDALCVGCVAWLHDCSRPIIRRLYPIWQLPAFVRAWMTAALPAVGNAAGGEKAGNVPQLPPPQAG
jgi:hypothetical protein